jgi:hypothetical protein
MHQDLLSCQEPPPHQGPPSHQELPPCQDLHSHQRSPPRQQWEPSQQLPPSQQPPPPRAGKQKHDPYNMDDDDTMGENTPLNTDEEQEMVNFALEASCRLQREDRERAEERGEASTSHGSAHKNRPLAARIGSTSASGTAHPLQARLGGPANSSAYGSRRAQAEGSRRPNPHVRLLLRTPLPDQTPPGGSSQYVTDQMPFCLQHFTRASRSEGSHTFFKMDTKWDEDVTELWLNPLSTKGWYWNNGRQLQMARKAAEIPFDQRSLAQRWAIREVTQAEALPEGYCSVEPNVKEMGQLGQLPPYLRRGVDSRISTSNWMVWLFLAMTQPEQEAAVVNWYWWAACCIFIGVKTFNRAMGERPLPTLEGIRYIPRRLQTPAAGFKINDLVEHFVKCGLRP